ncbi:MAG: molybdopterin-dependent oxidoreductase [Actinobacteria bacterium]|nr:molybdopterin-dependent oxidoreductase [Actinomycetota bacterium]
MARRPRRVGRGVSAGADPVAFVAQRLEAHRPGGPFAEGAFQSPGHDERVAARLGLALAVAFLSCFATGLISHFAQHPLELGFLSTPAAPGGLYRFTQGVHVASGLAAIPLLLFKLWSVYPLLFSWPPARNLAGATERLFVTPLVALAVFQLFSGLANTVRWYPWEFNFTVTHFWSAWMLIGVLVVHIGAKWHQSRRALRTPLQHGGDPAPVPGAVTRRGLLWTAGAGVGAVTLTTVGQTFQPLKDLALLAPRAPDVGPQGLPVNRTAGGAGVLQTARDPAWRLTVDGAVREPLKLSLADLRAMTLHEVTQPITCVEGWSASARWTGVRVRDLLERAGAAPGGEIVVHSLQTRGSYRTSELNTIVAGHEDTLLALAIGGEPLHLDHGFPCRLIAPNRPGVMQTKWVARLEVRT